MHLRKNSTRAITTATAVALLSAASLTTAFSSEAHHKKTLTAAPLATWQTNGVVWTIEYARGVVYVGGTFDSVRPPGAKPGEKEVVRKNFAAFDAVTGKLLPCAPAFAGGPETIRAMKASPDGRTLYVGGSFGKVDKTGVSNVAALNTADCSLRKNFRPAMTAPVRAIATTATSVYLGGDFGVANGQRRKHIAVFSPSGKLQPFSADIDESVLALLVVPDHKKLIVGGRFDKVNGAKEHALVALNATTGSTVNSFPGWLPQRSSVKALARDKNNFYLGAEGEGTGIFDGRIAGRLSDGHMVWKDDCQGATQTVLVYKNILYSGSHAHNCGTTPGGFPEHSNRQHFLANATSDGRILHWFPDTNEGIGQKQGPRALVMAGKILWAAGEFTQVNGKPQQSLTRFAADRNAAPETTPKLIAKTARAGRVTLNWRATWDRDDAELTYRIYRDGTLVASRKQRSAEWDLPDMKYTDSVAAGSHHRYTIAVTDGKATTHRSVPLDVAATAEK
ncbi:fibronectin type III domain-containing protein [Streptomyces sp. NPDC051133]|uniref:fibronectin type III domain-containing protein n=1 Tax=Streptomyces sp. NPDC051133 TaxID=3155521 RepID=UPI0034359995